MRMKTVCEQTGLTDRAVRYYIEEGLIEPEYIENYIGRRAYAFSEEDVAALRDIVVLRKYGFSVAEIKQMQTSPDSIPPLVEALRERKRGAIEDEQALLNVLQSANIADCAGIRELTSALSDAAERVAIPQEDATHGDRRRAFRVICRVVSILFALLELFGCAAIVFYSCMEYHYPKGSTLARVLAAVFLLPAILTLVLPLFHGEKKWLRRLRRIAAILCIFCLLPSLVFSVGIVNHSETDNIWNYRRFDVNCTVTRGRLDNLFPTWAPIEDIYARQDDRLYYYRYDNSWNETFDVYAEWSLTPEHFSQEVERAAAAMENCAAENAPLYRLQKGDWVCLYRSDESNLPFEYADNNYDYQIFAYREDDLRVRYIDGHSYEHGSYQPYYLELDWN